MLSKDQLTVLFIKQFNCAAHRAQNLGELTVNYNSMYIPGLAPYSKINSTWKLKPSETIHPFAVMLAGTRCKSNSALRDFKEKYPITSTMETFSQGFLNAPHYQDSWNGLTLGGTAVDEYYYYSLYFNLGRAFLDKFFHIKLKYDLPQPLKEFFLSLK